MERSFNLRTWKKGEEEEITVSFEAETKGRKNFSIID